MDQGNRYMEFLYSLKKKRQNSSPSEEKGLER